jgi:hypothetical protein
LESARKVSFAFRALQRVGGILFDLKGKEIMPMTKISDICILGRRQMLIFYCGLHLCINQKYN